MAIRQLIPLVLDKSEWCHNHFREALCR